MTGDSRERAWILADDDCGQFDLVADGEVERAVAKHFFFEHHRTGRLREGRDWRRIDPPPRCDLCGMVAERPWWEHIATPRLAEMDDLDGVWLVCDACHALVVLKDLDGLLARSWEVAKVASPWIARRPHADLIKSRLRKQVRLVLERFDAGRREEVGEA